MGIEIGNHRLEDPVILAPMSGVTDLPFRRLVKGWGAGLVVSEMGLFQHPAVSQGPSWTARR